MASYSSSILVLCTMMCIPTSCAGFNQHATTRPSFRSFHWTHHDTTCIHSTTSSSTDKIICDDISRDNDDARAYQGENNDLGVELWLDLRGTSLTPKVALELWHMDERLNKLQHQSEANDAKVIAKPPFVKCLVTPNTINGNENSIDVLHVAENNDGDDMKFILQAASQSNLSSNNELAPMGRILSLEASPSARPILPDPLPAMEVASKGQWIIVDTNDWKKVAEEDRMSMVLPLVELISSSATGSGGIGLTCQTNNEIVKSAMFIRSMTGGSGGGGTSSLDSGIVIPSDDGIITNVERNSGVQNSARRTAFALVVPFDLGLLKTANLLCGDN